MRIEHLETLLTVVEFGSMNRAAEVLFRTQPAVTAAIKSLEAEVGFAIIERNHKGVVPTAMGTRVVEEAKLICNCINGWKDMKATSSTVTFTFPEGINQYYIGQLYLLLRKRHPDIEVTMLQNQNYLIMQAMDFFGVSLLNRTPAEAPTMIEYARRNGMQVKKLFSDEFVILLSGRHPLAGREEIDLSELKDMRLICYQPPANAPFLHCLRSFGCDCDSILRPGSSLAEEQAVVENLGFMLRPKNVMYEIESFKTQKIMCSRVANYDLTLDHYLIFPGKERITDSQRAIAEETSGFFSLLNIGM